MTQSLAPFNHNAFFENPEYDNEFYHADQMPERPSTRLTVRILLDPNFSLNALTTTLWDHHNMELTRSPKRDDIVVISGYPSSNDTTKDRILQIVQRYDPKAKLLS